MNKYQLAVIARRRRKYVIEVTLPLPSANIEYDIPFEVSVNTTNIDDGEFLTVEVSDSINGTSHVLSNTLEVQNDEASGMGVIPSSLGYSDEETLYLTIWYPPRKYTKQVIEITGVIPITILPALSLTAPSAGTKYKLSESFNVTWTSSNITLVNVILESESGGYKKYSDVDATLGTLAVSILASDGFSINETVYIYIENTHQTVEDSVQVQSIATPTITALTTDPASPEPATNFVFSGESTYLVGEELTLQYSTDDETWLHLGVATVQPDGTWSKDDCQIADAGTYYLRAIYGDEVVGSESISVTVESGETYLVDDDSNILVDDDSNRLII